MLTYMLPQNSESPLKMVFLVGCSCLKCSGHLTDSIHKAPTQAGETKADSTTDIQNVRSFP